jgi:hypothetical protein
MRDVPRPVASLGECGKVRLVVMEWVVPVGLAVGKLLLRASGKPDMADAVGDAQEGWGWLRRSQRQPEVIGRAIADRLEKRLAAVTDRDEAQDLAATAQDVADLISRLADDDEAVRVAAAHPEQFLAYAKRQGGENLRRLTPEAATPLFDQILEAAATEFAALAPSSSRFASASLTEVLRQVEALPEIHENSRRAAEGVDQLLAVVPAQRARVREPVVSSPYRNLIAQVSGMTEAELVTQQRVVKVVQEFPDLSYDPGGIPPGRTRADPKPSAIVWQARPAEGHSTGPALDPAWVAVEYVPTLEVGTVRQAIEDNFLANGILVIGLDGSAIGGSVAVSRADPITFPSRLEIDQDWPLERVVREALKRWFHRTPEP